MCFKVIFYDKKNQREVSHDQLMQINMCESVIVVENDRPLSFDDMYIKENQISDIGYKVDKTNDYVNFDHYLMESDLVFLRLEEENSED